MICKDFDECFEHIGAYIDGTATGYPFVINTENYADYQKFMGRFSADSTKKCVYVSDHTLANGLPDITAIYELIRCGGNIAVSGLAQAFMLMGDEELEQNLDKLISYEVRGRAIVLLCHCRIYLEKYLNRDPRLKNRILLFDGEKGQLPQIRLAKTKDECIGDSDYEIKELLSHLEKLSDEDISKKPEINVVTHFTKGLFHNSLYAIYESDGIYSSLKAKYSELSTAADKSYGTDEQWKWLYKVLEKHRSFSALIAAKFGDIDSLSKKLGDTLKSGDKDANWLLWLALKIYGSGSNEYLSYVLTNSDTYDSLTHHIYQGLLDVKRADENFEKYFSERRQLLNDIPENLPEVKDYCKNIGIHGKDAVYYLTDATKDEEFAFMEAVSKYAWSDKELYRAVSHAFPELAAYLGDFIFDATNTKLSAGDEYLYAELTEYFKRYKLQKLKNRVESDFVDKVNRFAQERPFYKLQPRSAIVKGLDKTAQGYFFDALGVEYLSYIEAKCEKYGLLYEINIAHCNLPSITSENKDFNQYFQTRDIKELDELKHHSTTYDYTKCEYPIHIFEELRIINAELENIRSALIMKTAEKVVIFSDHGASRLAVIYKHESDSKIELEENSVHSGRCCRCSEDPALPQAAYENGYAVLANYERFKGGRKANLEVHGGASLEEVLVPIITLSLRPSDLVCEFVESKILYKIGEKPKIELFCNMEMTEPKLKIGEKFYIGSFTEDRNHAEFILADIKKQDKYLADAYDGGKIISANLEFELTRNTKQKDILGLNL